MRTITIEELQFVSGGDGGVGDAADSIAIGGAVGSGLSFGLAQKAGVQGGARLALAGGVGGIVGAAVTASFIAGYKAGEWANENTPVQEYIADGINALGTLWDSLSFGGSAPKTDVSYYTNYVSVV